MAKSETVRKRPAASVSSSSQSGASTDLVRKRPASCLSNNPQSSARTDLAGHGQASDGNKNAKRIRERMSPPSEAAPKVRVRKASAELVLETRVGHRLTVKQLFAQVACRAGVSEELFKLVYGDQCLMVDSKQLVKELATQADVSEMVMVLLPGPPPRVAALIAKLSAGGWKHDMRSYMLKLGQHGANAVAAVPEIASWLSRCTICTCNARRDFCETQFFALDSLGSIGGAEAVTQLRATLRTHRCVTVKMGAARNLQRIGLPTAASATKELRLVLRRRSTDDGLREVLLQVIEVLGSTRT